MRERLVPGAVAQVVADLHGVGTGPLYTWRKQMLLAAMMGFAAAEIWPEALPAPQITGGSAGGAGARGSAACHRSDEGARPGPA